MTTYHSHKPLKMNEETRHSKLHEIRNVSGVKLLTSRNGQHYYTIYLKRSQINSLHLVVNLGTSDLLSVTRVGCRLLPSLPSLSLDESRQSEIPLCPMMLELCILCSNLSAALLSDTWGLAIGNDARCWLEAWLLLAALRRRTTCQLHSTL